MSDSFLDSNILIYLFDQDPSSSKRHVARRLLEDAIDGEGAISFQVIQELLNVLTRPPSPIATDAEAEEFTRDTLSVLLRVLPSLELYASALRIKSRYHYGFYDSLIIAAALEAGCTRLYSEDLQHGQRIESLTITNPFI
jgi:predicted nucleic acid-binding protein